MTHTSGGRRGGSWHFTVPKDELLRHLAQRRSRAEIGRHYGVHPSQISRAVQRLTQQELAAFSRPMLSVTRRVNPQHRVR